MSFGLDVSAKYELSKSFTELAIQNNLFYKDADPSVTAKNIAIFFDTMMESIDSDTE